MDTKLDLSFWRYQRSNQIWNKTESNNDCLQLHGYTLNKYFFYRILLHYFSGFVHISNVIFLSLARVFYNKIVRVFSIYIYIYLKIYILYVFYRTWFCPIVQHGTIYKLRTILHRDKKNEYCVLPQTLILL